MVEKGHGGYDCSLLAVITVQSRSGERKIRWDMTGDMEAYIELYYYYMYVQVYMSWPLEHVPTLVYEA